MPGPSAGQGFTKRERSGHGYTLLENFFSFFFSFFFYQGVTTQDEEESVYLIQYFAYVSGFFVCSIPCQVFLPCIASCLANRLTEHSRVSSESRTICIYCTGTFGSGKKMNSSAVL